MTVKQYREMCISKGLHDSENLTEEAKAAIAKHTSGLQVTFIRAKNTKTDPQKKETTINGQEST